MTEPLVSVVIPCFNGAGCIADAIESALAQTYSKKEVVIVDDGSTDNSIDIIRKYGDAVRLVTGKNGGVADARNRGAMVARGELLQFLDQDDLLYPNKLERQVPCALANRPGMVFCDADVIDYETARFRGRWSGGYEATTDSLIHTLIVTVQTSASLHWQETFWNVGGFRNVAPPCEDRDLHLRMACDGVEFIHVNEVLYVWRRHERSQSKQNPTEGIRVQRRIGEDAYRHVTDCGTMTPQREAAFAGYFAWIARRALRLGNLEFASENFRRAREIHCDGGFSSAYSPAARLIARTVGPRLAENIISWKRRLSRHEPIA